MGKIKEWEFPHESRFEDVDRLLSRNFGSEGKVKIDLHHYPCMNEKYPKLEVGKYYYIDKSGYLEGSKYVKIKITYIRSGHVFYVESRKKAEEHFEEGSMMHLYAEPIVLEVPYNPEYYEVLSRSGKMKVKYNFKGYDKQSNKNG